MPETIQQPQDAALAAEPVAETSQSSEEQNGRRPSPERSERLLTQEDVDRIIRERLERERRAWEQRLEVERDEALKAREEAEKRAAEAMTMAEAKVVALTLQARPDRIDDIVGKLDLASLVDESGSPKREAIETALKDVLERYPEWRSDSKPPRSGGDFARGEGARTFTAAEVAAMTPEQYEQHRDEILAAMREGRIVR